MDACDVTAQVYQAATEEVCKATEGVGLSRLFSTPAEDVQSMSAPEQGNGSARKRPRVHNSTGFFFQF